MRRSLVLMILALVFAPSSASAHSNAVDIDPAPGATLKTLPAKATVTFNETPKQVDLALTGPDGELHVLAARVKGSTVTVALPTNGPHGTYRLAYRVVSADGHPVSGTTTFTVTAGPPPTASPASSRVAPARAGHTPPIPMIAVLGIAVVALGAIAVVAARGKRR
jgi:methionine-rich copper-binding protein CopC